VRLADKLPPLYCRKSRISGALTYAEPLGPPRPVAGDLYFLLTRQYVNHDALAVQCQTPQRKKSSVQRGYNFFCPIQNVDQLKKFIIVYTQR
jgi:hypothetical protein